MRPISNNYKCYNYLNDVLRIGRISKKKMSLFCSQCKKFTLPQHITAQQVQMLRGAVLPPLPLLVISDGTPRLRRHIPTYSDLEQCALMFIAPFNKM